MEASAPQRSRTERLLVVDDQATNIQVVGGLLGRLGYDIVPATNGQQAMQRMAAGPIDLILLDVLMEGMDGFEVCRQIQANEAWAGIPVIFLSAADDKERTVRAFDAGGVDYVTKPFNQAELVSRVRTHLALKAARDRLKQLAEDKDELLGILAHDCKNHLAGIHMTAQLLRGRVEPIADQRMGQMVENIERSSAQMLAFVKEFLANAAADHQLELKPQWVCLKELLGRLIREHQDAAGRKQLKLKCDPGPGEARVLATPEALGQVFDNLLSNAIKFSPPGREIVASVAAGDEPGSVDCSVVDHGPGFTPEDRRRLFRRYTRLSARPTGGEPSTGLGLSIVKKLVDAMNGQLWCGDTPGGGATFRIRFRKALPSD